MKGKRYLRFVRMLTLILAVILAGLMGWYHLIACGGSAHEANGSGSGTDIQSTQPVTAGAVRAKLTGGKGVKIGILGDSFAANGTWSEALQRQLTEKYVGDVIVNNKSTAVTDAYQGYSMSEKYRWSNYDALILCFGAREQTLGSSVEDFTAQLEATICNACRDNPNMEIVFMISNYMIEPDLIDAMKTVADAYHVPCVDMNTWFEEHNASGLTDGDAHAHPTESGYEQYAAAVMQALEQGSAPSVPSEMVCEKTALYTGTWKQIPADQLSKSAAGSYTYSGAADLFGVSYTATSQHRARILVFVNGKLTKTIDAQCSQDSSNERFVLCTAGLQDSDQVEIYMEGSSAEITGVCVSVK